MEHRFNVRFAKDYGIEEAVLIDNLYFWIAKNVANETHKHDGRYWVYNSAKAFSDLFPYMNDAKIYRVLTRLEEVGFIAKGNFNRDKYNRTNWYSFTDKGLNCLNEEKYDITNFSDTLQNDGMHFAKMKNGVCENEKCILINNTDNKQQIINNKEEDTNVSPKKEGIRYKDVIDCWNECVGKKWGCVTKITDRRKDAIQRVIKTQSISQETLKRFFRTLPYADSWLSNPNAEHTTWKPDFDWWMANTKNWLTKGLEGGVHRENPVVFQTIMNGADNNTYTPQGKRIWFNPDTQSYWTDELYIEQLYDGYEDKNRPDKATLTLHNGRGKIWWNKANKEWVCTK